jgi:hypothetical protein
MRTVHFVFCHFLCARECLCAPCTLHSASMTTGKATINYRYGYNYNYKYGYKYIYKHGYKYDVPNQKDDPCTLH